MSDKYIAGPDPSEHVMAHKQWSSGRVTVHGYRLYRRREDDFRAMTDCGISEDRGYGWFWVEYQTINPEKAILCKRCWK